MHNNNKFNTPHIYIIYYNTVQNYVLKQYRRNMMEDDPNLATSLEDTSLENKIDSDIMTPLLGLPLPNSLLRALNQQGCVYLEDVDDQKLEKLGGNTKDVLAKTGKYVKKLEFISGDKVQESGLISTFSSCVDSILNGGVHLGEVIR